MDLTLYHVYAIAVLAGLVAVWLVRNRRYVVVRVLGILSISFGDTPDKRKVGKPKKKTEKHQLPACPVD